MFPFCVVFPSRGLRIPGIILAGWAQLKVKRTFKKYSEYDARIGLTAGQVAQDILAKGGLSDQLAVNAITLAAMTNTIAKGAIFFIFGRRDVAIRIAGIFFMMLVAGGFSLLVI